MKASQLRIYSRLQKAAHQAKQVADKALLEAASITTAQAAVLIVASESQGVSQKTAADQLGLKEPAIAAMVARLVKLGYLTRIRSQQDARAWELSVTEEGETALQAVREPFARVNASIQEAVGEAEVERFAEQLDALEERFKR